MRRLIIAACLVAGVAQAQVIEYLPTDFELTTADFAGNNDGTIVGGVTASTNAPVAGWKSAEFDGSTGRINFGGDSSIKPPQITFESWIKFRSLADNTRWATDWHQVAGEDRWLLRSMSSSGRFEVNVAGQLRNFADSTTGVWHHVSFSFDGTNVVAFLNGIAKTNFTTSAMNVGSSSRHVRIGNQAESGAYLDGYMSDVRIWNTARTASEIADNYTNRLTGTESGLVGYWPMSEIFFQQTRQSFTEFTWPADAQATNYVIRIGTVATNLPVVAETTDTNLTFNILDAGAILGASLDMFWRVDVQTATDEIEGAVVQFTADLTDFYIQPVDVEARQAFTMFEWDGDVGASTNYILRIGTDTTNLPVVAETTDTSLLIDLRTLFDDFTPEAYWRVDVQTASDTIEGAVVQFRYVLATIGDPAAEPVTARADSRVWGALIQEPYPGVPSAGLLAIWSFPESLRSLSVNDFEGQLFGDKVFIGSDSLIIDDGGTTSGVDFGQPEVLMNLTNSQTMAIWVKRKTEDLRGGGVMGRGDGLLVANTAAFLAYWRQNRSDDIRINVSDGTSRELAGTFSTPLNEWFHLALVYNQEESTIFVYMDSVLVASLSVSINFINPSPDPTADNTQNWRVGGFGNTGDNKEAEYNWFMVYDRALSQEEIADIMEITGNLGGYL